MSAKIIDGSALAATMKLKTRERVRALRERGKPVRLAAVLVTHDAAGQMYADRQAKACREIGIDYDLVSLPESSDFDAIANEIDKLNTDANVTGIMVHLPLPKSVESTDIQNRIATIKDVEGVSPANIGYVIYGKEIIVPCTALATMELIRSTGVQLNGAEAVVIGASAIVGRPTALLLTAAGATVTLCHKFTNDLKDHTLRADVLVVAAGVPNLISSDHVRAGAVVIDVGINRVTTIDGHSKTIGDVNFDDVVTKAAFLSPVPGGVGPMTVAVLLANVARAAELLAEV